ncbi:MAG TPA: methyl-accepting chemotaxis protein [Capsulimonadaceae bacterium]|jgi:methyl-accepting chemotaxis protein
MTTGFAISAWVMTRLKYPYKFALIGMLFLMPLGVVLYFFQHEINSNNSFALLERDGVAYCRPVLSMFQHVIDHEHIAVDAKLGEPGATGQLQSSEAAVAADIEALDKVDAQFGKALGTSDAWRKIKTEWEAVRANGNDASGVLEAHIALVSQLTAFLTSIGTNSNLILDPDVNSYYTMDSILTQVPAASANLAEARDRAVIAATSGRSTEASRTRLAVLGAGLETAKGNFISDVAHATAASPELKPSLEPSSVQGSNSVMKFVALLSSSAGSGAADVRLKAADAETSLTAYSVSALPVLDKLLGVRSSGFEKRRNAVDIITAVFLALAVFMFGGFYNATNQVIVSLQTTARRMRETNVASTKNAETQAVSVEGADELVVVVNDLLQTISDTDIKLKLKFEKMMADLSSLINETRTATNEIVNQAQEVAAASDDLAHRTAEQSQNVERSAASMEQMTSSVRLGVENAHDANRLAMEAKALAQSGGAVADEAVTAIGAVHDVSRRIETVVNTISDIAFQTNMLSLNASIEAARVGSAGRGFAVVAAEVRKLSERCSTSAKEIKELATDISERVEIGNDLVKQSGARLGEIVGSVNQVADALAQITNGLDEQRAGIEEVNGAVIELDSATQQNAALVEELAACSQAMSDRSLSLQDVVGQFGAQGGDAAVATAEARPLLRAA